MGERLRFCVLGPLRAVVGYRAITFGGARQRTILALLLLSRGRVVPVDTLVDAVWNGRPPATARTQVAICIAALRKTFKAEGAGDEVIVTAHPGYLLRTEGTDLDLADFTDLVAQAEEAVRERRLPEAAHAYTRALALWTGPVLAGVTGRRVEDEAARLEEVRLNTYDDATAVQLELGAHQDIVPELAAVVREHPLRERTRRHLMLAQYRSGRRAEAMETFRDAREHLIDELGMEPGPDLQSLHDAILKDDPALAGPAAQTAPAPAASPPAVQVIPYELPPDSPGFTGRSAELAALDSLVNVVADGTSAAVGLITGVAGVGKTGLAVHWAHRVSGLFPDGRLFADLRGYGDAEPTDPSDVLSRFLRSLGVPSEQIPAEVEARTALYRSVLAGRRVLITLDNVRRPSQVLPLLPGGRCCVVITSREQQEELDVWPPQARIRLGALSRAESVDLLSTIVGAPRITVAASDTEALVGLCDRLPLALRIVGARLASRPHWTVRHLVTRLSDEQRRLDELSQGESKVRAGFELSYRCLPADAARLYRRLGLLTVPDFGAWAAAALLDTDVLDAERLIENLVDAHFLEGTGLDATGRLRYRLPDLLRLFAGERAAAEEEPTERQAALDRFFRTCLTIAEAAHRREYGGDFTVLHGSVPRRPPEPELLDELITSPLEWFEAERLSLRAVIDQAAGQGADEVAWDLCMSMVTLFETRNYVEDWRFCGERALAACREAGNLRGQAAMLHDLGAVELRLRRLDTAEAYFDEALALHRRIGEEHGRALTLRNMAIIARMRGDLTLAMDQLDEARHVFRAVRDLSSEAHAMNNMAQIELDRGNTDEAVRLSLEAVQISQSIGVGGERGIAQGTNRLARAYLAQGRLDQAEQAFLKVLHIVKGKSDMVGLAYALLGLGETRMAAGAWQEAAATLDDALDIAARIDSPVVEGQISLALGEVCRRQGRDTEARKHLLAAQERFERVGVRPLQERAARALGAFPT
ncbi:AfsR/SARP family transcriptional regulator [Streptomyces swartbergensis]|uniref:Transcriptional regulator n=1 Tax=Streptomyces swartbergensis TaxID=487165 RepID=A0A243RRS4_9ACTN|nr:BTAD domain-containing putative transcriptional regulator [Streptomyces swartbergensis]OUC97589.1 transcriptional regulator [Streptomyces swartbergensis]